MPPASCRSGARSVTTEGGLDVVRQHNQLVPVIAELKAAGIRVSLFIGADVKQIETAAEVGAPVIEIHTGAWCEAVVDGHATMAAMEFERIKAGRGARQGARARGPCRPRPRPRDRRDHRGASRRSSSSTSGIS